MNLPWNAGPELLGLVVGAIVTLAVWIGLNYLLSRAHKEPKPPPKQRPVPITEASLREYVKTSSFLIDLETRLAAGLGLNLSAEPRDFAWAVDEALELGIEDIATLDRHLKEQEHLILRFASRFRWEVLRHGEGLRLLFQIMGASLGPERYMQFVGHLKHASESPESVLRAYHYVTH